VAPSTLRPFLDDSNVGPEVSVGEPTLPPNADSGEHAHGPVEMFSVLSGELERVVNGSAHPRDLPDRSLTLPGRGHIVSH
jgi:hypothetical protein